MREPASQVHHLGRMMHGVEPPQQRHRVKEPVDRVLREVGDDENLDELHDVRLRRDRRLDRRVHRPAEEHGRGHQRQQDCHLHQQVAHREMGQNQ
jgi:hypothetical protein